MALYRTDPYHTILYRMHVYRTVPYGTVRPYRSEIKTNTSSSRGSWRNSYLPYGTVRYRTERYGTVRYRTAPRAVCGGALCRTGQTARANIFCGGSRSQAHAQFRYQIILQVGDRIFVNYWLTSFVVKTCSVCVTIDMATGFRASLPVP
jgi:hypothetical protein